MSIRNTDYTDIMAEKVPEEIRKDLERACELHQRATSDYAKCEEFSKLMSNLLARLEDAGCFETADKVMGVLLDCNPKIGAHCDKATTVGQMTQNLQKLHKIQKDCSKYPPKS